MKRMSLGLFACGMFMVVLIGCSVKEDRNVCPGRLELDLSGIDDAFGSVDLLGSGPGGVVFRDVVTMPLSEDIYMREVPHGMLDVNVWYGAGECINEEQGIVIPLGEECPPLYMHSFVADTRGEIYRKRVELHKNYCCLTLKMKGMDRVPYGLSVRGNVDGYRLDGSPRRGEFCREVGPQGWAEVMVRVPRQMDASLMLEVDDGYGVRKSLAIGEYIVASGYDWDSEDLSDVTVTIDYYITYLTVMVQKWDEEYVFDLVL